MPVEAEKWRFAVDRGGTFTDVIGVDPNGAFHSLKLLSDSPGYKDASIEGIRRILGLRPDKPLPEEIIKGIRFGTTVATNALLERKGCRVALLVTKGFSDLLQIGYQNRPDIFSLCIKKPSPLYSAVIEVDERLDSNGNVVKKPDAYRLRDDIIRLRDSEVDAIAVVFMHSWINPSHELLCKDLLEENGFTNIFLSHRAVNHIKIVSRGQSTLVDSYLSKTIEKYINGITISSGSIPVEHMQSDGRLSQPLSFTGKKAILSGPAGGVIAVAGLAERMGSDVLGFDMGGTSTDVSRFDGDLERVYEQVVGGIPLQSDTLNVITVAAGGGSILSFEDRKMTVGPLSAGANPGPASYGLEGPLTVTDANLITGRIIPEFFPATFGIDGKSPLNTDIVKKKFRLLTDEINNSVGTTYTCEDVASGFIRVANEKMAAAIKEISVSKGFDTRDYSLVSFGGAGGQHACSVASLLGIDRIIIHPLSSLMSAYGIGLSSPSTKSARTILKTYSRKTHDSLRSALKEMEKELLNKRVGREMRCLARHEIDIRPQGIDSYLTINYTDYNETLTNFKEQYKRLFGFSPYDSPLEVVNLRVEVLEIEEFFTLYREQSRSVSDMPGPVCFNRIYITGCSMKAPVYMREMLPSFASIKGPAFIIDSNSTVVIEPGFNAETDESGLIVITRLSEEAEISVASVKPDPILLEVFNSLFKGVASEMGITLQNTAHSVNMKERLDFSCALFDSVGNLVANAPHIPVHLGAMSDTVKAILEENRKTMRPGDIYLTNDPYKGGSHLPDMTIICPVFSDREKLIFITASRGHHSDIGGITPGSMPPYSTHLDEEGVLIDNLLLVRDGIFRERDLTEILSGHRYPVRNISERISDLKAQIAACNKGMKELRHVIERYGLGTVLEYMNFIQDNSEYSVRKALNRFLNKDGFFSSTFEDHLDDGTLIKVLVTIESGKKPPETLKAVIDFTGTGIQHISDSLNAPLSVVRSAVIYVLRSLVERDIPLNSGCLKPVDIIVPKGSILNPSYPMPVASGNVETSQRVVDVLLGAFGIAAASQGTMNNLLFEVKGEAPYYETIAGGSGAVEGSSGASGVQVHMTNTRITDPEILEYRHPGVRLERFTLRRGSGGRGRFHGGDGVIREIRFLRPATVSILSERRVYPPYGAEGGEPGRKGVNLYKNRAGKTVTLGHREVLKVDKDESIIIMTPGGGGYGKNAI
jgi:5-oxoprolinase (ATP-hydrolysing)